jgi:hypothetical protein
VNEERRGDRRRRLCAAQATLRPGCDVSVIDLSSGGALVQGHRPLRPGARVHVRLETDRGIVSLAAYVLRCMVWSLDGEEGVMYRGALRFEAPCLSLQEPDSHVEEASKP